MEESTKDIEEVPDEKSESQSSDVSGEWWEKLYRPHYTAADWDALELKEANREEEEEGNIYFRIWREIREKEEKIKRGEISK